MLPARPRVGLLVPRFAVLDGALGPERVDRLRWRREPLARALEPYADVVASVSVEDESGMSDAADGWRLAWLEGEALGEASPHLRGVAVRFRPRGLEPLAAASSWIGAGVTHHPVLVPGHAGETLTLAARALGARAIAA
jgi:hypothetical protein